MKDLSFLKSNLIAHRGCFNNKDIPENTIPAFKSAIKGNHPIELDIHLLKDNTIVVYHDDNLKRLIGIDKKIIDYDYKELVKLKILNTKYTIPKLIDVLELIDSKVPIIIEIKGDRKAGELEPLLIKILDKYKGKYVVKSFDYKSVLWFKNNKPEYIRGLLIDSYTIKTKINIMKTKPDFLSLNYNYYKKANNLRKKYFLLGWTIRNKKTYNTVKKSFDNLIVEKIEENNYE